MNILQNPRARDVAGGALVVLIGIGTMIESTHYPAGTLSRMGPGFFPMALGVILTLIGVVIAVVARLAPPKPHEKPEPLTAEWRGWLCIALGVIAFGVLGKYLGLVPATFAIVFISALGDRQNTLRGALLLAVAMIVFCVAVFSYGLQIQFPLFGRVA